MFVNQVFEWIIPFIKPSNTVDFYSDQLDDTTDSRSSLTVPILPSCNDTRKSKLPPIDCDSKNEIGKNCDNYMVKNSKNISSTVKNKFSSELKDNLCSDFPEKKKENEVPDSNDRSKVISSALKAEHKNVIRIEEEKRGLNLITAPTPINSTSSLDPILSKTAVATSSEIFQTVKPHLESKIFDSNASSSKRKPSPFCKKLLNVKNHSRKVYKRKSILTQPTAKSNNKPSAEVNSSLCTSLQKNNEVETAMKPVTFSSPDSLKNVFYAKSCPKKEDPSTLLRDPLSVPIISTADEVNSSEIKKHFDSHVEGKKCDTNTGLKTPRAAPFCKKLLKVTESNVVEHENNRKNNNTFPTEVNAGLCSSVQEKNVFIAMPMEPMTSASNDSFTTASNMIGSGDNNEIKSNKLDTKLSSLKAYSKSCNKKDNFASVYEPPSLPIISKADTDIDFETPHNYDSQLVNELKPTGTEHKNLKENACSPQTNAKQFKRVITFDEPTPTKTVQDETAQFEASRILLNKDNKRCLSLAEFVVVNKPAIYNNMKDKISEDIDLNMYGELIVLGCNGGPPPHLVNEMKSKFVLRKRLTSNGVKEAFSYATPKWNSHASSSNNFTVSYNISPSRSVVVEYIRDKDTDMFQIGRYDFSPIDFRVLDVGQHSRKGVSRFACRVVIQRNGDHEARVYAAAFDSTGNIFLGERALTCIREGKIDGFTTNGVLMMHSKSKNPEWREVSVCGYIYPVRSPTVEPRKRPRLSGETNILQDGTLIDLCGVRLVWRTPHGLRNIPNQECLKKLNSLIDDIAPEGHFLKSLQEGRKVPFVFLCCGHVIKLDDACCDSLEGWSCPICRCIGPIARVEVGKESGLFVDNELPSHSFRPCGHVANLKTARFWSNLKVSEQENMEVGFCPFCATKLNSLKKYIKLLIPL